jgi:hypothetical protein
MWGFIRLRNGVLRCSVAMWLRSAQNNIFKGRKYNSMSRSKVNLWPYFLQYQAINIRSGGVAPGFVYLGTRRAMKGSIHTLASKHWTVGWVCTRTDLDTIEEKTFACASNWNPIPLPTSLCTRTDLDTNEEKTFACASNWNPIPLPTSPQTVSLP